MSLAEKVTAEIVNLIKEWDDDTEVGELIQDLLGLNSPSVKKIMRNFLFNSEEEL